MATTNTPTEKVVFKVVLFNVITIGCLLLEESFGQVIMMENPSETGTRWAFGVLMILQAIAGWSVLMSVEPTRDLYRLLCASKEEPTEENASPSNTPNNMETSTTAPRKLYRNALVFTILTFVSLQLEEVFAEILILGKPTPSGANWLFRLITITQLVAGVSALSAINFITDSYVARCTDTAEPTQNERNMGAQKITRRLEHVGIVMLIFITVTCLVMEGVFAGGLIFGKPTPTGVKWLFRLVMLWQLIGGLAAAASVNPISERFTSWRAAKAKAAAENNASAPSTSNARQV